MDGQSRFASLNAVEIQTFQVKTEMNNLGFCCYVLVVLLIIRP
jgi:hypothetical protein